MYVQWVPVNCNSYLSAKKLQISRDCNYQNQLIYDQIYKRTSSSLQSDILSCEYQYENPLFHLSMPNYTMDSLETTLQYLKIVK